MADSAKNAAHLLQTAYGCLEESDANGLRAILKDHPEVINARGDRDGRGVIHAAAEAGSEVMLVTLLDAGADPNMPAGNRIEDEDGSGYDPGETPLHYATRGDHAAAVRLLIARGANPNAEDTWGTTPLHESRQSEITEALLKAGADPNAFCSLRSFDETLDWFFVATPMHAAAQHDDAGKIRALFAKGAQIDATDPITQRTALHYAAARGHSAAVHALLELGADPNSICQLDQSGRTCRMTPLHYAASEGHAAVVRQLLTGGADAAVKGGPQNVVAGVLAAEAGHGDLADHLAGAAMDWRPPDQATFLPDYGLRLLRDGTHPTTDLSFYDFRLYSLTVIGQGQYSTMVNLPIAGQMHALSLDFNHKQLEQILSKADTNLKTLIQSQLAHDPATPRTIDFTGQVAFGVRARLGKRQTVSKEQFVPLIAQEIL